MIRSVCNINSAADCDVGFDSFMYHRTASMDSDTIDMVFYKDVAVSSRK